MNSKWFAFRMLALLVLLSLALAACQPQAPAAETPAATAAVEVDTGGPMKEVGEGEGEVSIVAWAGYIERGETDANYDWVTDFEKQTGCKVSDSLAKKILRDI